MMANIKGNEDIVVQILALAKEFDYGTPEGWTDERATVLRRAVKEIEHLRTRVARLEGLS